MKNRKAESQPKPKPYAYQEILQLTNGDKDSALTLAGLIDGVSQVRQGIDIGVTTETVNQWEATLRAAGIDPSRIT
jgi:hypothetical protein